MSGAEAVAHAFSNGDVRVFLRQVAAGLTIAILGATIIGLFNVSTRVSEHDRDIFYLGKIQAEQQAQTIQALERIERKVDQAR